MYASQLILSGITLEPHDDWIGITYVDPSGFKYDDAIMLPLLGCPN